MSTSYASPTSARPARRRSLFGWIVGGLVAAAVLAAVVVAVWPASEADKARDDGEQLGQAVGELYYADSTTEVDAALAEIDLAVSDASEHAGDAVATQVADQEDALARAADGFVGSLATEDAFEAELYQAELETALDDLTDQASDFRAEGPEVHQAYWDGFQDGLPAH